MSTQHLSELPFNLVLVGGRGSGKSSVCRRILRQEKRFMLLSTDDLIRYESGAASIPEIVADVGWPGFRELEFTVIQKVANFRSSTLVDCGGGALVDLADDGSEQFSTRKANALGRHGRIVYLRRDIDYLVGRVAGDGNRPKLSDQESFAKLMARRDPWYTKAADHVLECTDMRKKDIVDALLDWYAKQVTQAG